MNQVVVAACLSLLFLFGWAYFFREAVMMWMYPPDWYITLWNNPEYRHLVKGNVPIMFMMSCAPLGFCIIWIARLVKAIKEKK
jgi:hypothetical protein